MNNQEIQNDLQKIVDDFNRGFSEWNAKHGCVANFGWQYSPYSAGGSATKTLTINDIDYIVYRKPAPEPAVLKAKLGDLTK